MEDGSCYAAKLVSFEGIIYLILFIITLIISIHNEMKVNDCKYTTYNDKCYFDNFYAYYEELNTKEVFIFIIVLIYYSIYYFFFYSTIYYFDIYYIFFILIFKDEFLYDIFFKHNETNKNNKWKLYINIILLFILLFMLLVFNGLIKLNCFGLSNNTKRNIMEREFLCRKYILDRNNSFISNDDNYYIYTDNNLSNQNDPLIELTQPNEPIINEDNENKNNI